MRGLCLAAQHRAPITRNIQMTVLHRSVRPKRSPQQNPRLLDGLQVPDEVLQRIQALLHREGELVVDGPQELGHAPRRYQVRRSAQPDTERVQLVLPIIRVLRLFQVPAGWKESS